MILLAMAGMLAQGATVADPPATLGEIRMHLFYAETGRLSRDISPPNSFTAWNTIIGEGDAEENADDLVIVVELRAQGEQNIASPLILSARNADGRTLGQRRVTGALTGANGRSYHMLHLTDAACAGPIRVTATFRRETREETLTLNCGE